MNTLSQPLAEISLSELSDRFSTEIHHRLDSVTNDEWLRMYPGLTDPMQLFCFIQETGMEGYDFHSIVVRYDNKPVLHIPLFSLRLELHTMLEGVPKALARTLTPAMPRMFAPRILGVGFVEGEWSAIGIDPEAGKEVLECAWRLVEKALQALFEASGSDLLLYVNFLEKDAGSSLPLSLIDRCKKICSYPSATLPITFDSPDAYLDTLSKATRKDVRRKLKKSEALRVVRTEDPSPYLDTIYRLYLEYLNRHDFQFGAENRYYFEHICEKVPGAHYVLYFVEERLLAFNLLIADNSVMVDKHYAMEPEGRNYEIYFFSWLENIRYCIEHKLSLYLVGPSAEATKARMGGRFLPSVTLFRHRNRLVHAILSALSPMIAYRPDIDVEKLVLDEKEVFSDAESLEKSSA